MVGRGQRYLPQLMIKFKMNKFKINTQYKYLKFSFRGNKGLGKKRLLEGSTSFLNCSD